MMYMCSDYKSNFFTFFLTATWQALRQVFPGCVLKGCVFHWVQRVYRKVQGEGLATAYMTKGDKYEFLRKVMALPFLPAEHISSAFEALFTQAADVGGPVLKVVDYIKRTWITNQMWRPENWSVFRETVRTNNDVEGIIIFPSVHKDKLYNISIIINHFPHTTHLQENTLKT